MAHFELPKSRQLTALEILSEMICRHPWLIDGVAKTSPNIEKVHADLKTLLIRLEPPFWEGLRALARAVREKA